MIVSRAPVRFSLGGGGSDLPAYAAEHGGFLVAGAIDKYIYISANPRFHDTIRLSYSQTEIVERVDQIQHRIFREALRLLEIDRGIELVSVADVPANCGLGSSSTFCVALLNALHAYKREYVPLEQLAEEACHIEIDRLGEPIGKQDQYMAAFGRITALTFEPGGRVEVETVRVPERALIDLESNLLCFHTGIERRASSVLSEQSMRLAAGPSAPSVEAMHRIKAIGHEVRRLLERGDVDGYGALLDEHWQAKRKLASNVSSALLDEHYQAARRAGALGGKVMGAGGGGFFLFYCRDGKGRLIEEMARRGLRLMRFRFDFEGAKIAANLRRS
jgi:D-glycero-alpha-D-manno-heptose-7-phosphate kinase